jgi:hypothetical protein
VVPQQWRDPFEQGPLSTTVGYVTAGIILLVLYGLLWLIARDWMVFDFMALWKPDANIADGLRRVWFIFVWGAASTALLQLLAFSAGYVPPHRGPAEMLFKSVWISVNAGFFEEMFYRWLVFFSAMVIVRALNAVTFGLAEWVYTTVLLPVANVVTFGALAPQLVNHPDWILGAAVISSNATFRRAHQQLGYLAVLNSWVIGIVLFWLMFNYGLVSSIIAHSAYDLVVFATVVVLRRLRTRGADRAISGPGPA